MCLGIFTYETCYFDTLVHNRTNCGENLLYNAQKLLKMPKKFGCTKFSDMCSNKKSKNKVSIFNNVTVNVVLTCGRERALEA